MTELQSDCPVCGALIPQGKKFCPSCGGKLSAPKPDSPGGDEVRTSPKSRRFGWQAALALVLVLTLVGAAAVYLSGVVETNDGGQNGPGPAAGEGPLPQVLCREGKFGDFSLTLKIEPRECEVIPTGAPIDTPMAGTAFVLDLTWINWGPDAAIADGEYFVPSFGPRPVKVRLFRPKVVCGTPVFTEISVTREEAQSPTGQSLSIEGCPPGSRPAAANVHLPLPGGTECGSVAQQAGTDSLASEIKVKGIECEEARSWLSPGNRIPDTWKCSARERPQGDKWNAMSHSDVRCTSPDGAATLVFAFS